MSSSWRNVVRPTTVLLACFAVLVSCQPKPEKPPATFTTANVQRGSLSATVSATGTLNPLVTVQVGSQVSGRIERIAVDFNSPVKKGEVIAQIEPSLFETEVAQAQANLQSAEAALEKARVGVRETQRQLQRAQDLRGKNLLAESELDTARFAQLGAVAEERLRQAAVAQAQAELDRANVNLAHTTIYAPINGVVVSRSVDVGQTVAASLQTPTLFSIAQDLSQMQIETQVDEAFIGQVQEGQPVSFTVFAYPGRTFTGQVSQVRLNPTVESGVVRYNCIIRVANPDLALKPGMTATVTIEVAHRDDVLIVPNAALRFVPEWPAERLKEIRAKIGRNQGTVWVPSGGDFAPQVVDVGLVGEKQTEVSGSGIGEGAEIAVPVSGPPNERSGGPPRGLRLF